MNSRERARGLGGLRCEGCGGGERDARAGRRARISGGSEAAEAMLCSRGRAPWRAWISLHSHDPRGGVRSKLDTAFLPDNLAATNDDANGEACLARQPPAPAQSCPARALLDSAAQTSPMMSSRRSASAHFLLSTPSRKLPAARFSLKRRPRCPAPARAKGCSKRQGPRRVSGERAC